MRACPPVAAAADVKCSAVAASASSDIARVRTLHTMRVSAGDGVAVVGCLVGVDGALQSSRPVGTQTVRDDDAGLTALGDKKAASSSRRLSMLRCADVDDADCSASELMICLNKRL